MVTYTSEQAAKALNCDIHKIAMLRENGLLHGIRIGKKGWIYSEENLQEFWQEYIDEDLSNPDQIRMVSEIHKVQKKSG